MNVWARRTLVVVGILILIFGGLFRGLFLVIALITAGVMFVLAGREPSETQTAKGLLVIRGQTWTRDSSGRPNRWNPVTETWEVIDPAPPHVIMAWDRQAASPERTHGRTLSAVGVLVATVLVLAGWALVDPYANIPVISQVVCSLKGASWQEGSTVLDVPPGCYDRSDVDGDRGDDAEDAAGRPANLTGA